MNNDFIFEQMQLNQEALTWLKKSVDTSAELSATCTENYKMYAETVTGWKDLYYSERRASRLLRTACIMEMVGILALILAVAARWLQ